MQYQLLAAWRGCLQSPMASFLKTFFQSVLNEAVSILNQLDAQNDTDELVVLGVNTIDSENRVRSFMLRNKVTFDMLWGADPNINEGYEIDAFPPQVVLLDEAGVVSYSGSLDVQRIMAIINKGEVDDGL